MRGITYFVQEAGNPSSGIYTVTGAGTEFHGRAAAPIDNSRRISLAVSRKACIRYVADTGSAARLR